MQAEVKWQTGTALEQGVLKIRAAQVLCVNHRWAWGAGLMYKSRLGNIVIDCHTDDLMREAKFWSAALGCPLPQDVQAGDKFIQLMTRPGEVQVIIQRVDHDPRAHLDIETDSIEEEVSRLEKLGAVPVSRHDGWTVMQAPSGHRFCVGKPYRGRFEQEANEWK